MEGRKVERQESVRKRQEEILINREGGIDEDREWQKKEDGRKKVVGKTDKEDR